MIEIAEAIPFAHQANKILKNLEIVDVSIWNTPHKFAWINQPENKYLELKGRKIVSVESSAHYIRFMFDHQEELAIAEDLIISYQKISDLDHKSQLSFTFSNGYELSFKVKLYGFLLLGSKEELYKQQMYYQKAIDAISPLHQAFTYDYFINQTGLNLGKGSVKEALATKQHLTGIGNGVLQDILFHAKINPKRKINTLNEQDKKVLYQALIDTIKDMVDKGGRDTQLNILGSFGKYQTIMHTKREDCPLCHNKLTKEAYLGGKVIYCPVCQI